MKDKLHLILFIFLPFLLNAEPQKVEGFLNNKLVDISVQGTRVVVASQSGLNWCEDIVIDSNSWEGITGVVPASASDPIYRDAILQNEQEMIVQIELGTNELKWLHYNFDSDVFVVNKFAGTGLSSFSDIYYYGRRGDIYGDIFYLAMYDAGILQIKNGVATGILVPGVDTLSPVDMLYEAPLDTSAKVISIVIQDSLLYSLSATALYKYDLSINSWVDTLQLDPNQDVSYETIETSADGILVFSKDTILNSTNIYRVDMDSDTNLAFLHGNIEVVRDNNQGTLYVNDSIDDIVPYSETGEIQDSIDDFKNRIENVAGFSGTYTVNDIGYSNYGTTSVFAIASSVGLLYSVDEHSDEADETSFNYLRKEISISVGLDEIFAVPFIINHESGNDLTYFKYALAEDANVSIDIFDYNMDFVCRIIDNQSREAAGATGQSGLRDQDKWDGTFSNDGGRTVAPGLYYFRVVTDRGEQGFGKIIVAKN